VAAGSRANVSLGEGHSAKQSIHIFYFGGASHQNKN